MKLCIVFAALLALSLSEDLSQKEDYVSWEAQEPNTNLLETGAERKESLDTAASTYISNYIRPSQRPLRPWNTLNNIPIQNAVNTPQNSYTQKFQNFPPLGPVQSDYHQYDPVLLTDYFPSFSHDEIPQTNFPQDTNPQNDSPFAHNKLPQNNVQQSPQGLQNDYYHPGIITNTRYFGDNGNYYYEYKIGDGTHVGEQGWLTNPSTDKESQVKQGFYSYTGVDGRVYTVTWYADHTGFHAYGDHLPTSPTVPAAIQAASNKPGHYPITAENYLTWKPKQPSHSRLLP